MQDITFSEWFETYNPEENLFDEDAGFGGILFDVDGEELGHVSQTHPKRIWTYREDHHENKIIVKGFFLDGAYGFFLCDRIADGEEIVTVHNVSQHA